MNRLTIKVTTNEDDMKMHFNELLKDACQEVRYSRGRRMNLFQLFLIWLCFLSVVSTLIICLIEIWREK